MTAPNVSILLYAHNAADQLSNVIRSVIEQQDSEWEILIGDDGSKDATRNKIKEFLKDPRIRYHQNPSHRGPRHTLRQLLHKAKGRFVFCLSQESLLIREGIRGAIAHFMLNRKSDAIIFKGHEHPIHRLFMRRTNAHMFIDDTRGMLQRAHIAQIKTTITKQAKATNVSDKKPKKIGLAVLTYNRLETLKVFIESFNKTNSANIDLCVFDDCSEDGTRDWLRQSGLKYLLSDVNLGIASNSNRALLWLKEARYDIGFLANDDIVFKKPGWAERYIEAMIKTPYKHLTYNDLLKNKCDSKVIQIKDHDIRIMKACQGVLLTLTRDVLKNVGGFDTDMEKWGIEHIDWSKRIEQAGLSTCYADIPDSNAYISLQDVPPTSDSIIRREMAKRNIKIMMEGRKKNKVFKPITPMMHPNREAVKNHVKNKLGIKDPAKTYKKSTTKLEGPIAIVIPSYQRPHHTIKTITAFNNQTAPRESYRIILVESGPKSTLSNFVKKSKEGTIDEYLFLPKQGLFNKSWCMNVAIKSFPHDFYVFHDADCIPEPNMIEKTINAIKEKPNSQWIRPATKLKYVSDKGSELFLKSKIGYVQLNDHIYKTFPNRKGGTVCFSRNILERIGGWPESFEGWGLEDCYMIEKAKLFTQEVRVDAAIHHIWHGVDSTRPLQRMETASFKRNKTIFDSFFKMSVNDKMKIVDQQREQDWGNPNKHNIKGRIAIIIGIKGRFKQLQHVLESLNAQKGISRSEFTICVVETDAKPQMPKHLKGLIDRHVFAYRDAKGYNRSWAFNVGFRQMYDTHEIFVFHDGDLWCPPNFISNIRDGMIHPIMRSWKIIQYPDADKTRDFIAKKNYTDKLGPAATHSRGGSLVFTKDAYIKVGGHAEEYESWGLEDFEMWEKAVITIGSQPGHIDNTLVHLWHGSNSLMPKQQMATKEYMENKKLYRHLMNMSHSDKLAYVKHARNREWGNIDRYKNKKVMTS